MFCLFYCISTFCNNFFCSIGIKKDDNTFINLSEADSNLPNNIVDFLKGGEELLSIAKKRVFTLQHCDKIVRFVMPM